MYSLAWLLLFSIPLWGAPKKDKNNFVNEDSPPSPVIGKEGLKRISDAQLKVTQNHELALKNIKTSEKNIQVIEAEEKELQTLDAEHNQMLLKYQEFLKKAQEELTKNQTELSQLKNWELATKGLKEEQRSDELRTKLLTVEQEKLNRETWAADAQAKIERVKRLIDALAQNKKEIAERRPYLEDQLAFWKRKIGEYQATLRNLEIRKKELEKLAQDHSSPGYR